MADELPTLWENFSLTEVEDLELSIPKDDLQNGVSRGRACVIGKLIVDRMVSKETIRSTLLPGWDPEGDLSFKVLGANRFLIEFDDPSDKERVMARRPWVFEGSLFIIEDFDGLTPPSKFTFEKETFWVRMIDLPLACMSAEIGRRIGASVGQVKAVDTDSKGIGWGEFLRVKIQVDITKPLPRGRKINIEGNSMWVKFQYERLPKFCFQCGVICHGKGGCPSRTGFWQQETKQYGPWMRAPSPPRRADKLLSRPNPRKRAANQVNFSEDTRGAQRRSSKNDQGEGSWRYERRSQPGRGRSSQPNGGETEVRREELFSERPQNLPNPN
jgi:hypothetical protein